MLCNLHAFCCPQIFEKQGLLFKKNIYKEYHASVKLSGFISGPTFCETEPTWSAKVTNREHKLGKELSISEYIQEIFIALTFSSFTVDA